MRYSIHESIKSRFAAQASKSGFYIDNVKKKKTQADTNCSERECDLQHRLLSANHSLATPRCIVGS